MIINDDEKSTRRLQKSARLSARRSARGQKSQKPQNPPPEKMEKQDPPSEKVKSQQAIEPEPKQEDSPKEPNPSESTGESGGAVSTVSHILKIVSVSFSLHVFHLLDFIIFLSNLFSTSKYKKRICLCNLIILSLRLCYI